MREARSPTPSAAHSLAAQEQIPLVDVPYAVPLVYQLDRTLQPLASPLAVKPLTRGYYLGDAERIKAVQKGIRESLVCDSVGNGEVPCELPADEDEQCFVVADGEVTWACVEDEPAGAADPGNA